jgi:predicted nucleic acid-binding protein
MFIATERAFIEAERRIVLGLKRPDLIPALDFLKTQITVIGEGTFIEALAEAAQVLRQAVASANGSIRDAHILALAWSADADIWSADRDFAGTGVASWSTPNLMRALAEA